MTAAVLLALALGACEMGTGMDGPGETMLPPDTMSPGDGMGMGLGESAEATVLAEGRLDELTAGPLVWVAREPSAGETTTHRHAAGFVYAAEEAHTLMAEGSERTLSPGEALFLGHGVEHTHLRGRSWDITLETLQPGGPGDDQDGLVFASDPLEDVPEPPVSISFIDVVLPAGGGQTAVHTHPGPEFIYVTAGELEYETALSPTEQLGEGDQRSLPADTAVQKRNPRGEPASFLSWFVVDPARPFSEEARFE